MGKLLLALLLAVIEIAISLLDSLVSHATGYLAIARCWLMQDYDYKRWLKRDLADCESILELGCGANSPILQIGYGKKTVAVDIWEPYVDMHNRQNDYLACYQRNLFNIDFRHIKTDAIVVLDVLEHLPKNTVIEAKLFKNIEQCAKEKIILFTPNGFVENDLVDGDPHQAHVSAWEPEDYTSRGYTVRGATGFRWLLGKGSRPKYHPFNICSILAMLSKPIVFNKPRWAWHSYAVKDVSATKREIDPLVRRQLHIVLKKIQEGWADD